MMPTTFSFVRPFVLSLAALVILSSADPARAQTEGRISVGGSVTVNATTDDEASTSIGVGPLVRLNPRRGWGPAGALNWFRTDLLHPDGSDTEVASLRIRPLMAGVAYAVGPERALVSFSIVAGPSFNSIEVKDEFIGSLPAGSPRPDADVETSFAVRPGVGVTLTVAPRVAIVGFGGYLINRPGITFRDEFGQEHRDRWKADSVVLSVGVVYSLF